MKQLSSPVLPPLRSKTTIEQDASLVANYDALSGELGPMFKRTRSVSSLKVAAAPVVSRVLGRQLVPAALPDAQTLAEFCYEVLESNPVAVSRARRRLRGRALDMAHRIEELLVPAIRIAERARDHRLAAAARAELEGLAEDLAVHYGIGGRAHRKSEAAPSRAKQGQAHALPRNGRRARADRDHPLS